MNTPLRPAQLAVYIWAGLLVIVTSLLPVNGTWTIDDGIKRLAAENATGVWAERLPDGPVRASLPNSALYAPFKAPFMERVEQGFAPGFSPSTRGFFKLIRAGGLAVWKFAPPLFAIALALLLARAGFVWAFLLLPLTFYGLVPWEHTVSWLLLWPALALLFLRQPSGTTASALAFSGMALALATLLRPETGILALLFVLWLLFRRRWREAVPLTVGGLSGTLVLLAAHALSSRQTVLLQLQLNFGAHPDSTAAPSWLLDRGLAIYRLLVAMDSYTGPSLLLFLLFVLAVLLLYRAQRQQKKALLGLGIGLLVAWCALWSWRLWTQPLPIITLLGQNSLFACLPWMAASFLPPYRGRPLFILAVAALTIALLAAPVWQGAHWGPRVLLFALPLFLLDLHQSGRARGWLFVTVLSLSAVQTVNSAALVAVRRIETATRITRAESRLGSLVICANQHQCADLAPLWPGREFFTTSSPAELRSLLIDLRAARVDTAWLHLDAADSLYVSAFPNAKPVWPYRMTVFQAQTTFRSVWRIYELVINRGDSLWAPILEAEAGRRMLSGNTADALALQQEAVALVPGFAQGHHNLALLLAGLGRTEEARAEVRRALEINPGLAAARRLEELLSTPPPAAP